MLHPDLSPKRTKREALADPGFSYGYKIEFRSADVQNIDFDLSDLEVRNT